MELIELKKRYEVLAKKYSLPSFDAINAVFEIEKIDHDSDCLLRVVRKVMSEKLFSTLSFLELLLNPVSAPRVYVPYIKQMTLADKQLVETLYESIGTLSLRSLILEVEYKEKAEAELIIEIYKTWRAVAPELTVLMKSVCKPSQQMSKKERTYFG